MELEDKTPAGQIWMPSFYTYAFFLLFVWKRVVMETRLNLRVRTMAFVHAHVMLQNVQKFPVANLLCLARFFRFIKQKKQTK